MIDRETAKLICAGKFAIKHSVFTRDQLEKYITGSLEMFDLMQKQIEAEQEKQARMYKVEHEKDKTRL